MLFESLATSRVFEPQYLAQKKAISIVLNSQIFFIIFVTMTPIPPYQLSLWKETGVPGEKLSTWRLSAYDPRAISLIQASNHTTMVRGRRLDNRATEAPMLFLWFLYLFQEDILQ